MHNYFDSNSHIVIVNCFDGKIKLQLDVFDVFI